MNSIKDIVPSFDKVTSVTDSKEFVQTFCNKAIELLVEFNHDYKEGIDNRQKDILDSATHKIASTMRWLDLDDFVDFARSYKNSTLLDRDKNMEFLDEVLHYSHMIENSIRSKMDEL